MGEEERKEVIIILISLQLLSALFVSLLPVPAFRDSWEDVESVWKIGIRASVWSTADAWNTKRQLEKLNFKMKLEKTRCGFMNTDSH